MLKHNLEEITDLHDVTHISCIQNTQRLNERSIIIVYDWNRSLDLEEYINSSECSFNCCVFWIIFKMFLFKH